MVRVSIPFDGPLSRSRLHGGYPLDDSGARGATLTWACATPAAAHVVASVFAGDYAASPRSRRRVVPWAQRARGIRADAEAQPALPGMAAAVAERRRVTSYAERTAKRLGSVAARVGAYQ